VNAVESLEELKGDLNQQNRESAEQAINKIRAAKSN